jgi:hypothetical protein
MSQPKRQRPSELRPRTESLAHPGAAPSASPGSARVVTLRSIEPDGTVLIAAPGELAPRPALLALAVSSSELLIAIRDHQRALTLETPEGWVVVGLIRDRLDVDAEEVLKQEQSAPRVEIRAQESLELVCGRARLRLEKSGQVTLFGTDVSEEAAGTIRITAADVRIN